MRYPINKIVLLLGLFLTSFYSQVQAGVVITGTRVIYHQGEQDVSVQLKNFGSTPVLVQSWVDNGDENATPENIHSPYIITPPVNRVDAGKGQTLRLSMSDPAAFASDRESVSWLNVLEIPAKIKEPQDVNTLQMAFRSRIKLFYRPSGLKGDPNQAVHEIKWRVSGGDLIANNPTPWHVSLVTVTINGHILDAGMIAPKSTFTFKAPLSAVGQVTGEYVNDYGAVQPFSATVN